MFWDQIWKETLIGRIWRRINSRHTYQLSSHVSTLVTRINSRHTYQLSSHVSTLVTRINSRLTHQLSSHVSTLVTRINSRHTYQLSSHYRKLLRLGKTDHMICMSSARWFISAQVTPSRPSSMHFLARQHHLVIYFQFDFMTGMRYSYSTHLVSKWGDFRRVRETFITIGELV